MDGAMMNKVMKNVRPEFLNTKEQKLRVWLEGMDEKVKRRLEERMKLVPICTSSVDSPRSPLINT